jgi:hypothetical protein
MDGRKLHSLPEQEHLKRLLSHLEIDCIMVRSDLLAEALRPLPQERKEDLAETVAISEELDPAGHEDLPLAALAAEAAPKGRDGRTTAHRGLTL